MKNFFDSKTFLMTKAPLLDISALWLVELVTQAMKQQLEGIEN